MAKKTKKTKLSLKEEAFCKSYVSPGEFYGNGVHAYSIAYDYDISETKANNSARSRASQLLVKDKINARINELLSKEGFNAEHADKRLLHWMNQNDDGNVSVRAIQEFNKVKQRVTQKVEHLIVPITKISITTKDDKDGGEGN